MAPPREPVSPSRAAVPEFVGVDFSDAPPGHRFRMYFSGWEAGWGSPKKKHSAFDNVADQPLPTAAKESLQALVRRQHEVAERFADMLSIDAVTTAPFVTGTGIDHPLENGFAFADPYGLPYLPGSSIKGVLRHAAEQLALARDPKVEPGWSIGAVWWLFGFDQNSSYLDLEHENAVGAYQSSLAADSQGLADAFLALQSKSLAEAERAELRDRGAAGLPGSTLCRAIHWRGILEVWDAYLETPNQRLRVDIMNPHYNAYYQKGGPPSDDGSPVPIYFLAVPPGARLAFHIRCRADRLPKALREAWRPLLRAAFGYASDSCGFGAKTSVGYGRMREDQEAAQRRNEERDKRRAEEEARAAAERRRVEQEERERRQATMTPFERLLDELTTADEPRVNEVYAKDLAAHPADDQSRLAQALWDAYQRLGKNPKGASKKQAEKFAALRKHGAK